MQRRATQKALGSRLWALGLEGFGHPKSEARRGHRPAARAPPPLRRSRSIRSATIAAHHADGRRQRTRGSHGSESRSDHHPNVHPRVHPRVATASLMAQQNAAPAPTPSITGTLYDPAGHPADNTLLSVVAMSGDRRFAQQMRTDDHGGFRFDDVPSGAVAFRTPSTDIIDPSIAEIAVGNATVPLGSMRSPPRCASAATVVNRRE